MSFVCHLLLTFTFTLVSSHWVEPPIPDYLHVCQKNDPKLEECIKTSIEALQPVLVNGIPNVDFPSIDPLNVGDLFNSDKKQHGIQIIAKDAIVLGMAKFKIEDLDIIKFGKIYNIKASFPKLQVEGVCDIIAKTKKFSLNETCSFVETFNNSIGIIKARFSLIDDGWLVQTDKIDAKIKLGESTVKLYSFSSGKRITVSDDVEAKINKIFDDINDDLVPVVEKVLHHQLKDVSDKMFGNFSYDQLFPL